MPPRIVPLLKINGHAQENAKLGSAIRISHTLEH
jgi:hypothetical protein